MIDEQDIRNILGLAVRELRTKKGITQEKLAEYIGVQAPTIAKIETGKRFISSNFLAKICNFFEVDPYVFFLKNNRPYTKEELNYFAQINLKLDKISSILSTIK